MNFDWTDEAIAELRRLYYEGYSMSQMAAALGPCGPSRNAVIGKLHRIGLHRGHAKPQKTRQPRPPRAAVHRAAKTWKPRAPAVVPYYAPEPEPLAEQDIPMEQRRTLMELENHHCRWPIGEGAEMMFCGSPTADLANRKPYCAQHERMSRQPPRTTTRRPFIQMRGKAA